MKNQFERFTPAPVSVTPGQAATPGRVSTTVDAMTYRWLVFGILAAGYILVYFHRLCPAVVAVDMMRDLETGGALLGLLGSAYFYPYAIMQLPAGLLADSWGPRRTITLFTLVAVVGSLCLGMAPSVEMAIFGRILVGLGVSMLFVPTMKILTEWFQPREFARMTGLLLAMGGIGSLCSTTPLALLTGWLGWRMAFMVVSLLTLILAGLVWLIVRDRPSDLGWKRASGMATSRSEEICLAAGVKQVLSHRCFWPLAAWFFFQSAVFFSFGGLWGGPYLQHIHGLDRAQAGQILSMLAIGLIFGSPLQTWLSNNLFRGRKPVLVLSSIITVGIATLLAVATAELSHTLLGLLCLLLGMFTSASVVIGFSAAKELFPDRIAGTSIGLINLFPFAGGAVFQPVLGTILERTNTTGTGYTAEAYHAAFSCLLICAVMALFASLLVKETLKEGGCETVGQGQKGQSLRGQD